MNKNLLIKLDNIFKSFVVGSQEIEIIKDISFTVSEGEFLVIFGPSGCGKSTLLHIMLGLERPTKGLVEFLGKDLINNYESALWADLSSVLIDFADTIDGDAPSWVVNAFQSNDADPYGALGKILAQ